MNLEDLTAASAVTNPPCAVCGKALTCTLDDFSELHRVTSDCKPYPPEGRLSQCKYCGTVQKPNDASWRTDCNTIYSNYENYGLTGGVEQSVRGGVDGAQFGPRSELVFNTFSNTFSVPQVGRMLDYGCGMGPAILAASKAFPDWTIDGFDLDRRAESTLRSIPNFGVLFSSETREIDQSYDLIVLMHALEHIPDAHQIIRQLAPLLNPNGRILIQVPNRLANPFDLLVADHCIHFDPTSLLAVAAQAGVTALHLSEQWVTKELSLVIGNGTSTVSAAQHQVSASYQVDWLLRVAAKCREVAQTPKLGIFGTSIVATWLRSELGKSPAFYLDEDPAKTGLAVDGVPILHPRDAPQDSSVLLAMAPEVAGSVARRLAHLKLNFVTLPMYKHQIS